MWETSWWKEWGGLLESLEWDEQQEKEGGKALRKLLSPKPAKKSSMSMAGVKKINSQKARHHCIEGNMKIPEINQTSYQVSCLCQTGQRNHTRFQERAPFSM